LRFVGVDVLCFWGGVTAIGGTFAKGATEAIAMAARFRGMAENRATETRIAAVRVKVKSIQGIQNPLWPTVKGAVCGFLLRSSWRIIVLHIKSP
jgi:hypothetical protein